MRFMFDEWEVSLDPINNFILLHGSFIQNLYKTTCEQKKGSQLWLKYVDLVDGLRDHSKHIFKYSGSILQVVRIYISKHCLNYLKWFIFLEGGNVLYPSCILVSSSFPRLAQIVGKLWAAHHYKYPICNKFELTIKMSYSYTMDPFISRLFIHNLSCSYTMDPFITRLFHPQSNPPLMVLKPTSQQL